MFWTVGLGFDSGDVFLGFLRGSMTWPNVWENRGAFLFLSYERGLLISLRISLRKKKNHVSTLMRLLQLINALSIT